MSSLDLFGLRPEIFSFFDSSSSQSPESRFPLLTPARVVFQSGDVVRVITGQGERLARSPKSLTATNGSPVVGDWVLVAPSGDPASVVIRSIAPRRGTLSRLAVGGAAKEQLIATHVDAVLLLAPASARPNARRIERGAAWAAACGIPAIVGVAKIDLADDVEGAIFEARSAAPRVPVVPFSARTGEGLDELLDLVPAGTTLALAGPSGAGKSTLVNRLAGNEIEPTSEVRAHDGRGKHTTTWRRLVLLPSGRLLVDTPGYRELALWDLGDGLGPAFPELEAAAAECRFRDCSHETEPGCAVLSAVTNGTLDAGRLESRRKLEKEAAALERRRNPELARRERNRWKQIERDVRQRSRGKW